MQIDGAKKLIDERGGYVAVADALKWPKTTVHTFHRNDRAPDYRWSAIEALPLVAAPADAPTPVDSDAPQQGEAA